MLHPRDALAVTHHTGLGVLGEAYTGLNTGCSHFTGNPDARADTNFAPNKATVIGSMGLTAQAAATALLGLHLPRLGLHGSCQPCHLLSCSYDNREPMRYPFKCDAIRNVDPNFLASQKKAWRVSWHQAMQLSISAHFPH